MISHYVIYKHLFSIFSFNIILFDDLTSTKRKPGLLCQSQNKMKTEESKTKIFLIDCVCLATLSCPTLCDLMNSISGGSSVYGILQAKTVEWVAISFSITDLEG